MYGETENERLRRENNEWRERERQREVQAIKDAQAAAEAARVAEQQRLDAEAAKARAEEQERIRKRAWLNHNTDEAMAKGNDAFAAFLSGDIYKGIPAMGWPPGQEPDDYEVLVTENEAAADSPLTAALAKVGFKLR